MRRAGAAAVGWVLLLCALGACATPGPLPADASGEQLAARFAPCSHAGGDGPGVDAMLAGIDTWHHVTGVVTATREPTDESRTLPATVATEGGDLVVRVHDSFWPGVDWALANGATVWFGIDDGWDDEYLMVALVVTATGEVFFPGECGERGLSLLRVRLGDRVEEVVAALPTTAPGEVLVALGAVRAEVPTDAPTLLNPTDVDAGYLESLDTVVVQARITAPVRVGGQAAVLCTQIDEGWNDCLIADDRLAADPWEITNFVGAARELEFWLVDPTAPGMQPLGYLGTLPVPPGTDRITVTIDTAAIDDPTALPLEADGEPGPFLTAQD